MKRIEKIYNYILKNSKHLTKDDILNYNGFTALQIGKELNILRNNVSKELNILCKNNKVIKIKSKPVIYYPRELFEKVLSIKLKDDIREITNIQALINKKEKIEDQSPFNYLIGHDRSLKNQIEQAKAALMYPPNGLHTLIIGSTGVGKSLFANIMYKYAKYKNRLTKDSPFIVFNCADYSNNPQLLLSHIFGHVKGSFTGADFNTEGIIQKADGGILFLDEIHRLPPEGQEMIFYFMDTGSYNKLGETGRGHKAKVLLIGATTEDPSSTLLNTFMRRIPVIIKIPDFSERTLEDQIELVEFLFRQEAQRINKPIKISAEAVKAFIGSTSYGNAGQLKSNIQLACAKGFLNTLNSGDIININLDLLPSNIKKGIVSFSNNKNNVWNLIPNTITIDPNNDMPFEYIPFENDTYEPPFNIYDTIEKRAGELKDKGMTDEDIKSCITSDINNDLNKFYNNLKRNKNLKEGLLKIVDKDIVDFAEEIKILVEGRLNKALNERFIYAVSLHFSSLFKRLKSKADKLNSYVEIPISTNSKEYKIAKEIHYLMEKRFNLSIPKIEIEYLAIILTSIQDSSIQKRVGIVVAAHGDSTATSMVNVAKKLFETDNILAVDMPLEKKPFDILEEVISKVKQVDEGKGVLLLVDMGSLNSFGDVITERTNIITRSIDMVSTPLVLEAARKCSLYDTDLISVHSYLLKDFRAYTMSSDDDNYINDGVIVTICSTGKGTAIKLKELVDNIINTIADYNITVIPVGVKDVNRSINEILKSNKIIAIVGIINPNLGFPFISIEDLINGTGEAKLKNIIKGKNISYTDKNNIIALETLCKQSLRELVTFLNPEKIYPLLKNFIDFIENSLDIGYKNNKRLSIMTHLACALERVILKNELTYNGKSNPLDKLYFDTLKDANLIFKKALSLELSEDELYYMVDIIKEYQLTDTFNAYVTEIPKN
ncbi:sigma 54-interacting transcriptional regulator [Clostridium isatidis]|uniref:PTS sugar transporter subunit IIA n=1 Tax=Clostridium isatidis TaxID=182773 RepID=A0A343JCJ5_9CLOT|nr:sigma-54-dependent transcriptional regulator [Clostridium isatidis]ASW43253.1 PTS sugar transporter subunit IIA [Clostridium isatidis]